MLTGYEQVYDTYEEMGMATPIVSANKKDRGDGIKYKINICINWGGGAFGGYNGARGCGYPIHGPGVVHAHELGHACQIPAAWRPRRQLVGDPHPVAVQGLREDGTKPDGCPVPPEARHRGSTTTTQ